MRVHTAAGKLGAMWKRDKVRAQPEPDKEREARLEHRRVYQRRLRARYYAEGRNARGEKMPEGWVPPKQRVRRPRAKTAAERAERLRSYKRNWYARKYGKKPYRETKEAVVQLAGAATTTTPLPEIWVMLSSGVIRCPHCQKVVGEIKQQQQEKGNSVWHVV